MRREADKCKADEAAISACQCELEAGRGGLKSRREEARLGSEEFRREQEEERL